MSPGRLILRQHLLQSAWRTEEGETGYCHVRLHLGIFRTRRSSDRMKQDVVVPLEE